MTTTRFTMPTAPCRVPSDCMLCSHRIRIGARVAKHFATDSWVHVGCLIRQLNAPTTTDAN